MASKIDDTTPNGNVGVEIGSLPKDGGEVAPQSAGGEEEEGCSTMCKIIIGVSTVVVIAGVVVAIMFAMKSKEGSELGIPLLKPPVVDATPTGLRASPGGRRSVCTGAANGELEHTLGPYFVALQLD